MPVEITEHDEMPEWMRERLAAGDVRVRVHGRAGTAEEFVSAVEAARCGVPSEPPASDRR